MISKEGARRKVPHSPYVGPRPLDNSQPIYGRKSELDCLIQSLISERVVLLISPSGAGKTSLINAGLIPELRDQGFEVIGTFRVGGSALLPEAEGGTFVGNLLKQWNTLLAKDDRLKKKELAQSHLVDFVDKFAPPNGNILPVLIFDQFEEAVTGGAE